jgi:hypothetical protein
MSRMVAKPKAAVRTALAAVPGHEKEMETKMTNPLEPIRRRPDGSIDFDRYRADIHALRHQAIEDASKLGAAMKLAAAIAVMLIAIAVAPSSQGGDASCAVCTKAGLGVTVSHDAAVVPRLY